MRRSLLVSAACSATLLLFAACSGDSTAPPTVTPAITLAASSASGTIARGASSTTSLSITRSSSFTDVVALSSEGLPTGVTVVFTPASIAVGSTTSIATINVDQTAAAGTSNLTLRATGTGVTSQVVTYVLTVPAPAITVTAGSSAISVVQGASATLPITLTRTNGASSVTLTAAGAPTGVTATFVPSTLTTETSSTLTLAVAATTAPGTYPIVISAAANGATTQTATVQLTVTAAAVPAFAISAAPAALSVTVGQTATSTVTATRTGGFTGSVALTVEGAPTGMTATATALGTGTTSTVTITTAATTVPGIYTLTLRGASAGFTDRTTTLVVTVSAAPGVTLALAPATLSIAQGAAAQSVVTLTRVGGFTGDVTMTAAGAPTGLTIAFTPGAVTGTSSTAAVTVGSTVAAGTYAIVITGTGAGGVVGTATLSVTVTVAQGFTLAATTASVLQGSTATSTIAITRTGGFAANVDLTATGLPANVTAAFNPASATGTTSTLTFTAAANAVAGTYTVTVNGAATGATAQSTTVTLTVITAATGGTNIAWKFCDPARVPTWFAFRNGTSGSWTRVTPSADNTFSFSVSSNVGAVAIVQNNATTGTQGNIYYNSVSELRDLAASECTGSPSATKTLNASFVGVNSASFQQGTVFVGGGTGSTGLTGSTAVVNGVPTRSADLIAYRSTVNPATGAVTSDRAVLRRNVNYAAGSTIPVIDFDGAESFAIASFPLTLVNGGADLTTVQGSFFSANGIVGSIAALPGSQAFGVPASRTQAGDLHLIIASAVSSDSRSFRFVSQYNRDIASRTATFGGTLANSGLAITATSPYARIRATNSFTSEYGDAATCVMTQGSAANTRSWTFSGSRAYFGSTSFEFELPDLSGVAGFLNSWGFVTGAPVQITTNVLGATNGILSAPAEGTSWRSAARLQTITP